MELALVKALTTLSGILGDAEKKMASKSVLVVGATGHLGRHFPSALKEKGKDVLLLLRKETVQSTDQAKRALVDGFVKQGARIIEGNMEETASLERACAEADAVISAVSSTLAAQPGLLNAAKKTGRVQRFIPSEFGFDHTLVPKGTCALLDWKQGLQGIFDQTKIPITYVYSNAFMSYWGSGLGQLGLTEPPRDQINVYGDGNVKTAMVTCEDIARYTVSILDDSRTVNRHVAISPEDNLYSQNELIAHWEKRVGLKLKRNVVSDAMLEGAIEDLATKPEEMLDLIYTQLTRAAWILGIASNKRSDALEATELYPDIKYERVETFLDRFAK
jgi:phenylcoumaran benzylic ether reductase